MNGADIDITQPNLTGEGLLKEIQRYFYTSANRTKHRILFKDLRQRNDPLELFRARLLQEARMAYPQVDRARLMAFEPLVRKQFDKFTESRRYLTISFQIEKFIDGIKWPQVQLEVRRAQPRTLDEAYQVAVQEHGVLLEQNRALEAMNRGSVKTVGALEDNTDPAVATLSQNSRTPRGRGRGGRSRGRGARSRSNVRTVPGPGSCFNCGEEGHQVAECQKPPQEKRCWNCNRAGHLRSECRSRSRGRARGGRGGSSRGRGNFRGGRNGGQVRKMEETALSKGSEEGNATFATAQTEAKN